MELIFFFLASSIINNKSSQAPIAEANSLLALAKAPVSLQQFNNPTTTNKQQNGGAIGIATTTINIESQLPANIAQSNQMVLNWLQVIKLKCFLVKIL